MRISISRGSPGRHAPNLPLTPPRRIARPLGAGGLAACALLAGCAPKAEAGGASSPALVIRSGAEYAWYDVEGATVAELYQSMRSRRPADQRALGRTQWNVTWRAQWSGSPCRVRTADVNTRIVVSMPRWKAPPDAPAELVAQWNEFIRALSVHEAGHVEHAVVAEREVRRALMQVMTPTCGAMTLLTRQAAERVLNEQRLRDRRYDERTVHGATQGARWPPRPPAATTAADSAIDAAADSAAVPADSSRGGKR